MPIAFLDGHAGLKPFSLTPTEALFIINLMAHKWDARAPFPGYKRIAKRMGITESYGRKLARTLEHKGFIQRLQRVGSTNEFDLTPLFAKLVEQLAGPTSSPRKRGARKGKTRPRAAA